MAGTDATRPAARGGPAVVLVGPQLGENIGAATRAMANGGLSHLRLVRPREPWPNAKARAAASGADWVLDEAELFDSVAAAIADLHWIWATTARTRDMVKPCSTPREAVARMRRESPDGAGCGILFGPERTGLTNDHLALASRAIAIPASPEFRSLNLAQAVLVVSYEWYQSGAAAETTVDSFERSSRPATNDEIQRFFSHLEAQLDAAGFLFPPEKRPAMVRNLRNLFLRADLTEQEVRTLHGVVRSLSGRSWEEAVQAGEGEPGGS